MKMRRKMAKAAAFGPAERKAAPYLGARLVYVRKDGADAGQYGGPSDGGSFVGGIGLEQQYG